MHVRKNNILICSYYIDKNDISEAQMAYEWISRLGQVHNLWVVTAGSRKNEMTGLEGMDNVKLVVLKPKLSFRFWDAFDRAVHPGYIEFYWRVKKTIREILSRERIDLCHHLTPQSVRYGSPLSCFDVKYLMGPLHGGVGAPSVMKQLEGKEGLLYKLRGIDGIRTKCDPVLKRSFKKAGRVVISADYMLNVLGDNIKDKSVVIPGTAVGDEIINSQILEKNNDKVKLVYVGRLDTSKGIELLIRSLVVLKNKNVKVDVYGEGSIGNYCKELAEKLGVSSMINWKGFRPLTEVVEAYKTADIFILPTLKEPAGIAVLEAMAAGLPIITVDFAGPGYAVDDSCGIKIKLSNLKKMVEELAWAIDILVSDQNKRLEYGQNAIERIKHNFTWDVVINKMLTLYEKVINEK